VRDKLDLSASDNLIEPSTPILLSAVSENEMKAIFVTADIEVSER
jgi:hypothetical protein